MADNRLLRLEREVALLRKLLHASSAARVAEQLVADADARCEKRLRRVRKKLLLLSHPDKTTGLTAKEVSNRFNEGVRLIMKS